MNLINKALEKAKSLHRLKVAPRSWPQPGFAAAFASRG